MKKLPCCRVCGKGRVPSMPYCEVHAREYRRKRYAITYKRDYKKSDQEMIERANRDY